MTSRHDRELPPVRLLDGQATPLALRDALRALRDRAPSAEASARIEQQLGRPALRSTRMPPALIALGVVALLGALSLWAWPEHQAIAVPRSASVNEAPALPVPATIPAAAPEPRVQRAAAGASVPIDAPIETVEAPLLARAPELSAGTAPALALPSPKRAKPRVLATRAAPMPVVAISEPAPTAEQPAGPPAPIGAVSAAPRDAERAFADPQDEAGLLYRARRLASSDPKAALRLLVLHEASFPDGAFGQERDMLEIRIHERLGHAAAARRLAARFNERYPASVYSVSP